jgi:hypothetical protein
VGYADGNVHKISTVDLQFMKAYSKGFDQGHGKVLDVYGSPQLVVSTHEKGWINIHQLTDHTNHEWTCHSFNHKVSLSGIKISPNMETLTIFADTAVKGANSD